MAHQLHYTSAATGLSGRPGFQFVAASPGATAAVQDAVTPYLGYQPPPSAPSQPTPAQLAEFPVAYTFARDGGTAILAQCRYLGTDYSGRYGNFLGHAVVADAAELAERAGLRPIELWGSPVWARTPAGADLPELTELPPGEGTDPDAVAAWLAAGGQTRYRLLAQLIDAALASLDGSTGQVVLVADQDETVARWVAAISYSLPLAAAWELSFVTYTADPSRSRAHLVGTTTDAWGGEDGHSTAFRLEAPPARRDRDPGRYATVLAQAWQRADLAGIDALNELVSLVGVGERDAAAALAELGLGRRGSVAGQDSAAALLPRCTDRLPEWVWSGLDRPDLGLELAFAVYEAAGRTGRTELAGRAAATAAGLAIGDAGQRRRLAAVRPPAARRTEVAPAAEAALRAAVNLTDLAEVLALAVRWAVPVAAGAVRAGTARAVAAGAGTVAAVRAEAARLGEAHAAAVLDGAVEGLAQADGSRLARMLPDEVCDLLVDRSWDRAPRVGAHVLTSHGRHHPKQRAGVTYVLTDLAERRLLPEADVDNLVRAIWRTPEPGVAECLALVGGDGLLTVERARRPSVLALAQRAFAAGDITTQDAYALAHRLQQLLGDRPDDTVIADAGTVIAAHDVAAGDPAGFARLDQRSSAHKPIRAQAVRLADSTFLTSRPEVQAQILVGLDPESKLRKRLVGLLVRRTRRPGDPGWVDFAELAVRLWRADQAQFTLTSWTAKWAGQPRDGQALRQELKRRQPELATWLTRMCDEHQRSPRRARLGKLFGRG